MTSHACFIFSLTMFGIHCLLLPQKSLHKTAVCKDDSVQLKCDDKSFISLRDVRLLPENGKPFNDKECYYESEGKYLTRSRSTCNKRQSCNITDDFVFVLAKCLQKRQNDSYGDCTKHTILADPLCWLYNIVNSDKSEPRKVCPSHSMCRTTGTFVDGHCDQKSFTEIHWTCQKEKQKIQHKSSKTIALAVGVTSICIIICICLFVFLCRRSKVKRKNVGMKLKVEDSVISHTQDNTDTTPSIIAKGYETCQTNYAVHQYDDVFSKPGDNSKDGLSISNCDLPGYSSESCSDKNTLTHIYEGIDNEVVLSTNRIDSKYESPANHQSADSYFILDPKEKDVDCMRNLDSTTYHQVSHINVTQNDSVEMGQATNKCTSDVQYEFAKPVELNGNGENLINSTGGQYSEVLNCEFGTATNQTNNNVYGHSVDGLYNISSHERVMSNDETYDHAGSFL